MTVRCSVTALARGDDLAGTASVVRGPRSRRARGRPFARARPVRGRTTLAKPAQYAEVTRRRQLGELRIDGLRLTGTRRQDDATLVASFAVPDESYEVTAITPAPPTYS